MNGLEVIIPSIAPAQRRTGTALNDYLPLGDVGERWRAGVKFTPFGRAARFSTGGGLSLCDDNDPRPDPGTIDQPVTFDPFEVSASVMASAIDGFSDEELNDYLTTHANIALSAQVAAQTERNVFSVASNDSLASCAAVIASADTSLAGAIWTVEQALTDRLINGVGFIHVPAAIVTMMASENLCALGPDGRWVTPAGNVVIGDGGYVGASPVTRGPVSGQVWVYASGPVVVKVGAWRRFDLVERFDRARNNIEVEVQAEAIVAFDPDTVVTAKITTSDGSVVS